LTISIGSGFCQLDVSLEISVKDLKEIDLRLQERDILKSLNSEKDKTISELEKSLSIAQKELELERRENEINQRIIVVKDMEIVALNRNFDQMKEIADRAIKLAETAKPQSNWQLYGIIGLVAMAIGALIAQ
jgi:SMC interacting uncharacterized protein involved in chromosome segregation